MIRMIQKIIALLLISSLTTLTYGESSRDLRHKQIRKRLKETSHLQYNYFAPSVHISYHHPEPKECYLAYYNEILVKKTMKHTYFCTIGFDVGYFGIQDHKLGHIAIFSVWDKGGGNSDNSKVDNANQTQVLFTNEKAKSSRFGGEGSGAKTMMPFPWEIGKTYAFMVLLRPLKKGTIYTAWISEKGKAWQKIAAYKTVMTKKKISGFYSFIEDYIRNGETGQKQRLAFYPDHGAMTALGNWQRIKEGSGTIADDVIQNGHSGVKDNTFFSQSGAESADYNTSPKRFSIKPLEHKFTINPLPEGFPSQQPSSGDSPKTAPKN